MEQKITTLTALLLCALPLSAQTYWDSSRPDHRLNFGVVAGGNLSKQYTMKAKSADHDFRAGFHVGLTADVNIVRSLSVVTGVNYVQKGWEYKYSDYRGKQTVTDNASFLQVPLLASYRVPLSDAAQFHLNVGPWFAFGLSGTTKVKNTFAQGNSRNYDSFDQLEGMEKFDMGVHVGAAIAFDHFLVGVSYERGLKNVSKVRGADYQSGGIQLTVGYKLKK